MKRFNELLLDIYRLAQSAPAPEFQTRVLERLQGFFDFDSAFWATGVVEPGAGVTAHSYQLYRQPPEMIESWVRINQNDALAFEAFRQQGTTVNAALCAPEWQARFSPDGRAHIKRYGMAHALSTVIAEPILQLWTGIALYQSDPDRPFTEQARADMQELVPHLSEAWNISRFALMDSGRDNAMSARYGRAICDRQGVLYNADQNFADLLIDEWPDWRGPRLPQELVEMVPAVGKRPYVGRHIAVSSETAHNMKRLSVRRRTVVDTLSAREHEVAALFASGANFRSTADSLHIAPVTVRNHLRQVYAKLGITNKLELARLMRQE